MVVAITGTRTKTDEKTRKIVNEILDQFSSEITKIIEGKAPGPDTFAYEWARANGKEWQRYPANWALGKKAGPIRNAQLVNDCDKVIGFWDLKSPGTKNCIKQAREANKLWMVIGV